MYMYVIRVQPTYTHIAIMYTISRLSAVSLVKKSGCAQLLANNGVIQELIGCKFSVTIITVPASVYTPGP